ncbi:MAG: YggS family pyridoxal phosphate-dependent enzyme [Magnetovibrio sp.]|nr:YggS family pyridoxal phosphate-dependent enzyme [Magnetovibrio sp.]
MQDSETASPDIRQNLGSVKSRIAAAAAEAGRDAAGVTLVAISKTHPAPTIAAAIEAGHAVFGENRVQESESKWPALKSDHPGVRLHLVGPLQSNKVKRAVQLFDAIETVDRAKLARALAREIEATGTRPDCFIQVNTGEEDQKAGIRPADADAFIKECREQFQLPLAGLMCIPPVDEEPGLHFGLLAEIARRNGLDKLSMGMSGDFETAIRFGATHVRVGTAIFGARPPFKPQED